MSIFATYFCSPHHRDHWIPKLARVVSSFVAGSSAILFVLVGLPVLQVMTLSHSTITKLEAARRMRSLTVVSCGPETLPSFYSLQPPPETEIAEIEVKPRVISTFQPRAPTNLPIMDLRGSVNVEFTVDSEGRVIDPTIQSTSNPALNQPTLDVIKRWRFEPGTRGGKRVPFKMMQPFNYG